MQKRKPDDKKTKELNKILEAKVSDEAETEDVEDVLGEGEATKYPRIAVEAKGFSAAVAKVIEVTEERKDCPRKEACEILEKLLSILHDFGYVCEMYVFSRLRDRTWLEVEFTQPLTNCLLKFGDFDYFTLRPSYFYGYLGCIFRYNFNKIHSHCTATTWRG